MKLFAQITKVNAETGEVHGRITQELPDSANEIMDYETSKPHFQEWSKQASEATGGLSKGNVRAMHGKVAAGKLTEISFVDEEKAIDVVAKIIDPAEREKCIEGVYTGFSIGGKYAKRWADGDLYRYTAQPSEVSLVDNPCLKAARFTLVKADGTEEERDLGKVAAREDVTPKEGENKYGDVQFADAKNKKYPIDTAEHIRAAWNYINKEGNAAKYSASDVASIKAKIVAAWKKKIDPKGPPSAEKAETWEDLKKYAGEEISDAASAIYALQSISYLYVKEMQETHPEAAEQLAALKTVIENLKAFIASEIQEKDADDVMLMAEGVTQFLTKVGARNSKSDSGMIQTIHDHASALGADCGGKKEASMTAEELQKMNDLSAQVEALTKADAERKEAIEKSEAEKQELADKLAKAEAEIEKIKANTPKPGGPALKAISKGEDVVYEPVPEPPKQVLKADGTVDQEATALELTKAALGNPVKIGLVP